MAKKKNSKWIWAGIAVIILIFLGMAVLGGFALLGLAIPFLDEGCVAVVEISGQLTTQDAEGGLFSEGVVGSEQLAEKIEELDARDDIKAVVFVINSPGGSAVASREIYEAIDGLKKPKVAYFREVAASGGYYIAAPTDYIISNPEAITGSISAIVTHVDLSGLFENVGYNQTAIASGDLKDMGSYARPLTEKEKEIIQEIVDESFENFKSIVRKGRIGKLDLSKEDEIFDGRIMSGKKAYGYGLVDEVGNKEDAIKKAAELGGIESEEPRVFDVAMGQDDWGSLFYRMAYNFGYGIGKGFSVEDGGLTISYR